MGMYTEFRIDCTIKPEAPQSFKDMLRIIIHDRDVFFEDHFALNNWTAKLEIHRSPEFFAYVTTHRFRFLANPLSAGDDVLGYTGEWSFDGSRLVIGTEVKNYDGVIDKFYDWVKPWIADPVGTVIGAARYEEFSAADVVVGRELSFGGYDD